MRATIFFLTFVVFVWALVLRVDQVMFDDKLNMGEAQSRAQMGSLSKALSTEVQGLKDIMTLSFGEIEQSKTDYPANRPYSRFHMLARLQAPAQKSGPTEWQIQSAFYAEKSTVKSWATSYITLALKTVQAGDIRSGAAHFFVLMDSQRQPYMLMVHNSFGSWFAGLLGPEVFQGLMDRQKGQKSTVFVVNLQGQALAHTIQEYIGNLLTEDPLVAELMKSSVGSGFGSFRDLRGESVQGLYEQIENTNLYAVITTPVKVLLTGRETTRMQLVLLGAGLALIGVAVFFLSDKGTTSTPVPSRLPPVIAPSAPAPGSVNSQQASAQLSNGADKMKAYVQVASSLSHELKSPLTSILGYSQLAMNQMPDGASKEHLLKIDNEARAAREIIQKLLIFAGEDKVSQQKVGLETVVAKALKNLEGKLLSKGIKVNKNFQAVTPFTMPVELVVRAVESVLLNSIEAMERAPKKELTISMAAGSDPLTLVIEDTGEGISSANLAKVFDPFFTTRSGTQHVGLGLSTALGIFKEVAGEMQIDSEQGKGTKVSIRFHPEEVKAAGASSAVGSDGLNSLKIPPVSKEPPSILGAPAAIKPSAGFALKDHTETEIEIPPLDPLVVDNSIERLIEGEVPDMPAPPSDMFKVDMAAEVLKAPIAPSAPAAPAKKPAAAAPKAPVPKAAAPSPPPAAELTPLATPGLQTLKIPVSDESMILSFDEPTPEPTAPSSDLTPMPEMMSAPAPAAPAQTAKAPAPGFSGKIDKPKIDIKKKTARVDEELQVSIRRPGERQ
jgi:two-component system, NtrC family, sensor kinase